MIRTHWLIVSTTALFTVLPLLAQEPQAVGTGYRELVPQVLLPLVHAREVHKELRLSGSQIAQLEQFFVKVDGPWFRARILPAQEQREVIDKLETLTHSWFSQHASAQQQQRLQQLQRGDRSSNKIQMPQFATRELYGQNNLTHFYWSLSAGCLLPMCWLDVPLNVSRMNALGETVL